MKKKNPEACHELNFFWSDDVQSGSSNIKVLPLRFMGEILPSNLDILQCWLLSDLGISWKHSMVAHWNIGIRIGYFWNNKIRKPQATANQFW